VCFFYACIFVRMKKEKAFLDDKVMLKGSNIVWPFLYSKREGRTAIFKLAYKNNNVNI